MDPRFFGFLRPGNDQFTVVKVLFQVPQNIFVCNSNIKSLIFLLKA